MPGVVSRTVTTYEEYSRVLTELRYYQKDGTLTEFSIPSASFTFEKSAKYVLLFRGQTREYLDAGGHVSVLPSAARRAESLPIPTLKRALHDFLDWAYKECWQWNGSSAFGIFGVYPRWRGYALNDHTLLNAVMQQYGPASWLLDVTENPFVGLWFATNEFVQLGDGSFTYREREEEGVMYVFAIPRSRFFERRRGLF